MKREACYAKNAYFYAHSYAFLDPLKEMRAKLSFEEAREKPQTQLILEQFFREPKH